MSIRGAFSAATRSVCLATLGAAVAVTCRAPSGQSQGVATPRVEPSNLGLPEAGARASDGGVNDGTIAPENPEEVPIERLIVEAAAYFGRRVTTAGWVVSCDAPINCKMIKCGSCTPCTGRSVFVPPGTVGMPACEGNANSLIIMDPQTLNKYLCHDLGCENNCERVCPFPKETPVRLTGTIQRAATPQIVVANEQFVFVPDPPPGTSGN